jgi:hypothetical protein
MGRLSDHVEIDPESRHHRILYNGVKTNVSNIAQELKVVKKGYLYSQDESRRYFYCQKRGIQSLTPAPGASCLSIEQGSTPDQRMTIDSLLKRSSMTRMEISTPGLSLNCQKRLQRGLLLG